MYFIKSLPPKNQPVDNYCYTRFGEVIPQEEYKTNSLKEFFPKSPLSEEKLLKAIKDDNRVVLESAEEREEKIVKEKLEAEKTYEKKIEKADKKRNIQKDIDAFNEAKEQAQATATKEDDKEIEKKEIELMKKIKEAENDSE